MGMSTRCEHNALTLAQKKELDFLFPQAIFLLNTK